ncbi:MAG: hypothetical protein Q9170_001321 [Blastenia crenularia]
MVPTPKSEPYSSLISAQIAEPDCYSDDEIDQQAQLNRLEEQRYQQWPKSRYNDVTVLLLRWEADNLNVDDEVWELEFVFQQDFNFCTETWMIPSEDPEAALTTKLMAFCKGKRQDQLIILYYAGHGTGTEDECRWSATESPESPWLNWHTIQGHLLGHPADVLIILDCCYASLATGGNHSVGANWFLGSSVKESIATGVSWRSFTSAMTRQLKRAANFYWDYRSQRKYSIQSLRYDLDAHERESLLVTPNCLRLSRDDCEATDLTPLIYPRQRPKLLSASTEPVCDGSQISARAPLPRRPRKTHATLPPSTIDSDLNPGSLHVASNIGSSGLASNKCQTLRLDGLPMDADIDDVTLWLKNRLQSDLACVHIGPLIANPPYKTTIATFADNAEMHKMLAMDNRRFPGGTEQGDTIVNIISNLEGFTTLYQPLDGEPTVDIVLIHGEHGHPIKSFASHYMTTGKHTAFTQSFWLRDELPSILGAGGIAPRVLTVGWSARPWSSRREISWYAADEFAKALNAVRLNPQRPLIFMALGLGCLLAQSAITNLISFGLADEDFQNPVRLCVFFGIDIGGSWYNTHHPPRIANVSQEPEKPWATPASTEDRKIWGDRLTKISQEFAQIQAQYDIDVLSLEKDDMTRERVSDHVKSVSTDPVHPDMDKPQQRSDHGTKVITLIGDRIVQKLGKKISFEPASEAARKENILEHLRNYDTYFLVDDSGSMEPRWKTTARVLAAVVDIAVRYDDDGVDVKFFNKRIKKEERTNLNTTEKVMSLFAKNNPPRGGTLTADVLEEVLREYMSRYRRDPDIKGLNLIVLTDGEPDPEQDVEEVLRDYAEKLVEADAPRYKVGVQFVQIGGDEAARNFLRFLDDELKKKHTLDRDMIDTVYWVEEDRERLHEKILLGGILKRFDKYQPEHPQS